MLQRQLGKATKKKRRETCVDRLFGEDCWDELLDGRRGEDDEQDPDALPPLPWLPRRPAPPGDSLPATGARISPETAVGTLTEAPADPHRLAACDQSSLAADGGQPRRSYPRLGRFNLISILPAIWLAVFGLLGAATLFWPQGEDSTPAPRLETAAAVNQPRIRYETRSIQDLRPGQLVLARDEHGSDIGLKRVEEVYRRTADHLRILEFADSTGRRQTLETTNEHPFWSPERGEFVKAKDLALGAQVVGPDGEIQRLAQNVYEPHPEGVPVYNFKVEDYHTYYVRQHENDEAAPVLVHNAQKYSWLARAEALVNRVHGPKVPKARSIPPNSGRPPIQGPIRPYNQAKKGKVPGYDDHHLDPPLGRADPSYSQGPTIQIRNDNAGGKVPGGINLHTAKGGFQTALREHITKDLGFTIKEWNRLPNSVRKLHLARYYASLGIPFPN